MIYRLRHRRHVWGRALAATRRARGIAPDGVVRNPISKILASTLFGSLLALISLLSSVGAFVEEDWLVKLAWFGGSLFLLLCGLHTAVSVWIESAILTADTIEARSLFERRSLRREDVSGFRRGENGLRLCSRHGESDDLEVMWRVVKNSAWRAWLETLPNFTLEEAYAEQAKAEADERLGRSVEERRARLTLFRRIDFVLAWLLLAALVTSTLFWTDPYWLGVLVAGAIPVIAIVAMMRWPVLAEKVEGLWVLALIATLILSLRAMMDINTLDVWPPRLWSVAVGVVVGAAWVSQRSENTALRNLLVAAALGVPVALWSWGALTFANILLDRSTPRIISAVVVERAGKAGSSPRLTVRNQRPPNETFKELSVSPLRFERSPSGTTVCVEVGSGLLGWRWGRVRSCAVNRDGSSSAQNKSAGLSSAGSPPGP
ncbi:MAG: hypothetical protein ACOVMT_12405 [Caulobacter sp.]